MPACRHAARARRAAGRCRVRSSTRRPSRGCCRSDRYGTIKFAASHCARSNCRARFGRQPGPARARVRNRRNAVAGSMSRQTLQITTCRRTASYQPARGLASNASATRTVPSPPGPRVPPPAAARTPNPGSRGAGFAQQGASRDQRGDGSWPVPPSRRRLQRSPAARRPATASRRQPAAERNNASGSRRPPGRPADQTKRLKTSVPLVPPKPNEFFSATSIFICRAVFAQ